MFEKILSKFIIGGVILIIIMIFIFIKKIRKEIKNLDKEKIKRDKELLKLLRGKKNKTY